MQLEYRTHCYLCQLRVFFVPIERTKQHASQGNRLPAESDGVGVETDEPGWAAKLRAPRIVSYSSKAFSLSKFHDMSCRTTVRRFHRRGPLGTALLISSSSLPRPSRFRLPLPQAIREPTQGKKLTTRNKMGSRGIFSSTGAAHEPSQDAE